MIYPKDFRYYEESISEAEEQRLLDFIHGLAFLPYVMRGQPSRRGIVRFGHDYGPVGGSHHQVQPLPEPLVRLRDHCAAKAGLHAKDFIASVVTEYSPGATIGWHSDMTMFGPVVFGISLLNPCVFKLRPKSDHSQVFRTILQPRSLYAIEGEVRSNWEHSIPAVKTLRYSITYRTLL